MKIELIVDENCLSLNNSIDILNKLAEEFSNDEVIMTSFESDRQRLSDLEIRLLPAWLIDNKVLRINPGDYELIRKKILLTKGRQQGEQSE